MAIHFTAIVGSKARIGRNVNIGPHAIIGDDVTLGDDCIIESHVVLEDQVTIGNRNFLGHGTIIGSAPQDLTHDASARSGVTIGDDNIFREYVTIHRGTKEGSMTTVGSRNMLMGGVHLGHNSSIGDRNILANNCLLAGYVEVSDDVTFGGGSVFHQFIRVGRLAMIRGGTAWSKDIPPFTVGKIINTLAGLNSVGMRRKGIESPSRRDIKSAYNLIYRSSLNISQAIVECDSKIWTPEGLDFINFVKFKSKRGLCRSAYDGS